MLLTSLLSTLYFLNKLVLKYNKGFKKAKLILKKGCFSLSETGPVVSSKPKH